MEKDNSKTYANDNAREQAEPRRIGDYAKHLQGLPSNKYGGSQLQRARGYRGAKYGKAGPVKIYSPEEIVAYANDNGLDVAPCVLDKLKHRRK